MPTSTAHPARIQALGLVAGLLSAATFGTSGPFAKALLETGWTSGAVVLLRVGGAAVVLLPAVLFALRGRWHLVPANLRAIAAYGLVAIAACQVSYFYAVQHVEVGVALLLEYLGVILIVLWVWARTRRTPSRLTVGGIALAVLGLALVLDLGGQARPDLVGVLWGLAAAVGLAVYYVTAAEDSGLPPVVLAGLGMVLGTVSLALAGAVGVLPLRATTHDVVLAGTSMPWWVAFAELSLVAAAAAYLLGIAAARRLGSTFSGFLGLTEVLFGVLWAGMLLGEVPGPVQAVGGAIVLVGVVAVRAGELRAGQVPTVEPTVEPAVEPAVIVAPTTALGPDPAGAEAHHPSQLGGIRLTANTAIEGSGS